jgi:T5SS/PEP-CTERM-associated repeat protein/autotransporter-associated beta strand protein
MARKYPTILNVSGTKSGDGNNSRCLVATALLTASVSVIACAASADEIIDGGLALNVPAGIQFDAAGYLIVGDTGFGQLNINGGQFTNTDAYIGDSALAHGEVFVTGSDAVWTSNGYLTIGWNGEAFVMVDDGARVLARDGTDLAVVSTSYAQLTLSGTSGARGVLSTPYIMKGAGTGLLQWDGGILQATRSEAEFLPNFAYGDIAIQLNGAFFDTNGFNVGMQTPDILIGTGGLTKLGTGTLTIAGGNAWSGDTTVTAGTLTLDSYLQSGSQFLKLGVAGSSNYGKLNVNGVATFNNSNLAVDVIGSTVLANNLSLTGVVTAGTLNASGFTVTDNSALFDFTPTINSNSVDLNVSTSGIGTTVYSSVLNNRLYPALGAASVLDTQVQGAPTGDMADVVTALGRLPDESSVARAAAQTLPFNAGADATLGALGIVNSTIAARFAPGRNGVPAADLTTGRNLWIKPLGSRANQNDTDNNASGYNADTWGIAAGVEGDIEGTLIGVAYAYANSRVDGSTYLSGAKTQADIDSHVIAAYGRHPINDMTLGFQIDAGWNHNESTRALNFGGLDRLASADYNSWNVHLAADLSKVIALGQDRSFIPTFRADYTRLRSQSYTEQGAGALNLDVNASTVDALTFGLDGRLVHTLSPNAEIEALVGASYDAINDRGSLMAAYSGTPGQSFLATGIDHGPWLAKAGLGFNYNLDNGMDVSLRYDAGWRKDYLNHAVSFKAAWRF